jgi:hypothetical protein
LRGRSGGYPLLTDEDPICLEGAGDPGVQQVSSQQGAPPARLKRGAFFVPGEVEGKANEEYYDLLRASGFKDVQEHPMIGHK